MAASLPRTWTAAIVTCSHWVGLTFPGMMDEPGSLAGIVISPRPQRGPEASKRTSLAIFIRSEARALMAPWVNTSSSRLVSAWNLFGAETNEEPVSSDSVSAASRSKPFGAFSPVPTAVPPSAISRSGGREASSIRRSCSRLPRQPEISWEKRSGVASCRWVRPILRTSSFSASRRRSAAMRPSTAGSRPPSTERTAATRSAVGKVSLEDWERLTSSFG